MTAREALDSGVVVVRLRVDAVEHEHVAADGLEEVHRVFDPRSLRRAEEELAVLGRLRNGDPVDVTDGGD